MGVILSGTGSDGAAGLGAIKFAGGIAIAQSPETAKHSGMPKSAIKANAVDYVLEPRAIADELTLIAESAETSDPDVSLNEKEILN